MTTRNILQEIPADPAALTPTWLTGALRRWGGAGDITVTSFRIRPIGESRGFFGHLVRLFLDYAGEAVHAPTSLIAKFSSSTAAMRMRSLDSYEREVRFYQQLARSSEISTPTCYYADINVETGEHILLLQDLAPMQNGSRVAGCSAEQAQLAVSEIAKLHLRWWGRTEDAALAWLADGDVEIDSEAMRRQYEEWWPAFSAQAAERLPPALRGPSRSLGEHRATIRRHIFGSSPRTLIHRDFQLDNLFFGAPGVGEPAFAAVDWQFFSRGRGVWDVAYFLSESLLPEMRRSIEMDLLARYHHTLVELGIDGYSFEQCTFDYRMALLQRHTALVSTLAAMPFSEEQRHIHLDILLPRNIAAILDHDAFALFS
jgi:hypothetical protein